MRHVLDASVGFKWAVVEPLSDKARQLRDDYRTGTIELFAPDVFPLEIAHALTRAERQGRITPAEGALLLADVLTTAPQLFPSLRLLPRAYAISSQMRIGVHDCLDVALAEQEGCELITADDRLVRALQAGYPFIVPLASLP
jgi:predicted nucleic acid-binding protein